MLRKALFALALGSVAFAAESTPPTVAKIMDGQLASVEKEVVSLAEAMPADRYGFAPSTSQGEFKGVRTFAQQVKHIASTNWGVCSSALGEKPPMETGEGENGPDSVATKDQIVKYLKDSYAYCHKAELAITATNLTDQMGYMGGDKGKQARLLWVNLPIWHSFDHYGQMVEYARMNGIIPPASRQQ
jgi:hypothetical protein